MKLPTLLLPLFLLPPTTTLPTNHTLSSLPISPFSGRYRCDTTPASPTTPHITGAVNALRALGSTKCQQNNLAGSHCTLMQYYGTAAVAICGTDGGWVECWRAAYAAWNVAVGCEWRGLAGGSYRFDAEEGNEVIVYHW